MGELFYLSLIINCIAMIVCLFRICTNRGEVNDYIVVVFTFIIAADDIRKIVKEYRKKAEELAQNSKEESSKTEDSSLS